MKRSYRILICIAACAGALLLPAFELQLLLPPVIALAGFMAAEWGVSYLMPVLLCGGLGFCVLQPWLSTGSYYLTTPSEYCAVASFMLVTVSAAYFMRYKKPNRYAMLAYVAFTCAGVYLSVTANSIFAGKPPYTEAVEYLNGLDAEFERVLGEAYSPESRAGIASLIAALPDVLMMLSLLMSELLAAAVFFFGRAYYRAFKVEPAPMAEFSQWRLPSSILWGLCITALVCAAVFLLSLNIAMALALTMGAAFVSLFALQGLSFMFFLFERSKSPGGLRVFTVIFIALFMLYTVPFLALIGIYEQIGKKRLLIAAYERRMKLEQGYKAKSLDYEKYGYTIDDIKNAERKRSESERAGDKDDAPAAENGSGENDSPADNETKE